MIARVRTGAVLAPIFLLALTAATIRAAGGRYAAFLNLDALAFVIIGTVLMVWSAFPVRSWTESAAAVYASQCAATMGWLGTILGMILLLSADDLSAAPRRMALSLNALFFGLILSKGLLLPLAQKPRRAAARLQRA